MAGTIIVDRIESDASYASSINVAAQVTFSNTVSFGATANVTGNMTVTGNVSVAALTATGVVTFPAGTAALPSITTSGDPDTGIYFPSANTIGFTRGGIEVGKFDSNSANANFQFNSGYGSVATAYGCRAWVNFNGTGTVAIRGSGNVSSITDNGTGDYTVTFTTAMTDANYSVVAGANGRATDTTPDVGVAVSVGATTGSGSVATGTRILVGNPSSAEDCAVVTLAVFR